MFLGYNTNGFAHHRLDDAVDILADLGYRGIALTVDVHHLDITSPDWEAKASEFKGRLAARSMRCVVETGSRFLLDPRRKHQPTLISPTPEERKRRLDFLKACVRLTAELSADCVSFWSGAALDNVPASELSRRLVEGCGELADYAATQGVRLAFEPEPGMFIDTMAAFDSLESQVRHPSFGLTVDVGHLVCNRELPASKFLQSHADMLWNVHIEDTRGGVHDHLAFGEGDVDFEDVFQGLRDAGYSGGVYVELSRHSHDAVEIARQSRDFLRKWVG